MVVVRSAVSRILLLHKIFFAPKTVKLLFTLLGVCGYFRTHFSESDFIVTETVAMATVKLDLKCE